MSTSTEQRLDLFVEFTDSDTTVESSDSDYDGDISASESSDDEIIEIDPLSMSEQERYEIAGCLSTGGLEMNVTSDPGPYDD